jgi:hypothetical protein
VRADYHLFEGGSVKGAQIEICWDFVHIAIA